MQRTRESEEPEPPARRLAPHTRHARDRGARRNVAPDAVDYVLAHGRMIQRTGATFYFLGRRDVPPADRGASWAARLEGTIVLLAADGAVITIYRNRHGARAIARKLKYRWPQTAGVQPHDRARATA
jgi:hypothetical protein